MGEHPFTGQQMSHSGKHEMSGLDGTALGDLDASGRAVTHVGLEVLDGLDDSQRVIIQHLAKDDVLAIEPGGSHSGDEELRAVGVLAGVGHGEKARLGVLELEVLVSKLLSVDRLASRAIAAGEVAALKHKVLDHPVEDRPLVAEALLPRGEGAEVLGGLGHALAVETEVDATCRLAADLDVEEELDGHLGTLLLLLRRGRGRHQGEQQHRRQNHLLRSHDPCSDRRR
mmetsp:Transcript_32839/g.82836  ORF Transcript_32839/g.82836 Transcript_32839/m.82836 type:complete len:228 (-) Transcript_32839:2-685(-)